MDSIPFLAVLSLLVISIVVIAIQYGRNVIATRRLYEKNRQNLKEREATADILRISSVAIRSEDANEAAFLNYFVEYVTRAVQGSGAAVFMVNDAGDFEGCGVAGTLPPIKEVTSQVEQKLLASHRNHSKFIKGMKPNFTVDDIREATKDNKFYFCQGKCKWFPERFGELARRIIIAPIFRHKRIEACVLVVSGEEFDEHALTIDDGWYLVRLNELASLSIDGIRMFRERQKYEESLQSAREEGMLQVSTGIIHNIGNAVTVAKLNVHELLEKYAEVEDRPEKLLLSLVLPKLREELDKGGLEAFLKADPTGSQYLGMMGELIGHIDKSEQGNRELLNSLANKLHHISEIIELQQRFVGELGTENLTALSSPLDSAIKIYEETFNKSGIKIETEIKRRTHDVLVDISMMTQVFINVIKNAGEAMASDPDKGKTHQLKISLDEEDDKENATVKNIVVRITDNGPGVSPEAKDKIFGFGFSTKNAEKNGHGFGLHNCRKTVEKYGGKIEVESTPGNGATFVIILPARQGSI